VDEWSIPIDALPQALAAIKALLDDKGHNVHFPIEVRFVAGDDAWLSPAYGRTSAFIGIIMYKPFGQEVDFKAYFRQFEEVRLYDALRVYSSQATIICMQIMVRYDGRPHWAKDFHIKGDSDFRRTYPKWDAFKTLRAQLDPGDTFVNAFVRRTLGLEPKLAATDSSLALGQASSAELSSSVTRSAMTSMSLHTQ
jgi:FAD/FMN-containing dehydrogenase